MTRIRKALIVGAGIAGPVAALALRRAGIDSVVYEARPGTGDGVGAMLAIAPNGLAAGPSFLSPQTPIHIAHLLPRLRSISDSWKSSLELFSL